MAIRLRSRAVIWTMASIPRSCNRLPTDLGSTAIRARGDSVMLIASTEFLSASAFAKNSDRSMPLGGVNSVVTTKLVDRIFFSKGHVNSFLPVNTGRIDSFISTIALHPRLLLLFGPYLILQKPL